MLRVKITELKVQTTFFFYLLKLNIYLYRIYIYISS